MWDRMEMNTNFRYENPWQRDSLRDLRIDGKQDYRVWSTYICIRIRASGDFYERGNYTFGFNKL
jgi:hypothetical protein